MKTLDRILVDIVGLTTSPTSGGAYALILRETDGLRRLPIIIGAFEAQSIALEMEGIKPPRPLTHDLVKNILETTGSSLSEVVINDLRDGTFFAHLNIDSREIDSRPSDAIALAVRFGAPIYVNEDVMDEASFIPEDETQKQTASPQSKQKAQRDTGLKSIENLTSRLNDAITREDYEMAAKLRDEIKRMQATQ
ncbi:MAG: hypothetical protein FJ218_10840 [Ignavibacteria bacterium]|nr:hypothetical protein [Ignavibacteria bacterium]